MRAANFARFFGSAKVRAQIAIIAAVVNLTRLAKLAHAASIAACPAHPDQSRRYAPPHGSRRLADE